MSHSLTLVTPPAAEPLLLEEVKAHLRVESDADDAYIHSLIYAARATLDGPSGRYGRALMTQTWDLTLDDFPCDGGAIEIPLPPVQSVGALTYLDSDGVEQTYSAANYRLVKGGGWHPRVELSPGAAWPATYAVSESVTLRFAAGYGDANALPPDVKHVMKLYIGHFYLIREPVIAGVIVAKVPHSIDHLIDLLRKRT